MSAKNSELERLQRGLSQALLSLQKSGLSYVPASRARDLPEKVLRSISELHSETAAEASLTTASATAMAERAQTPAVAEKDPVPPSLPASREQSAENVALGRPASWSLAVLDSAERAARLDACNAAVKACVQCSDIVCYRQQTVFGVGPLSPTICFMGEAPGADEDRQGVPFVGKAGQLLTKIIAAMKLKREEVYILNALKCRPPQNRTPVPEEIAQCRPFVETQLAVLQPKYIVCLGAVAVRSILESNAPIGKMRGRFHQYQGAKVVVTYHPSYLLRNESAKRLVWEDMQMLMRELDTEKPQAAK
ncbi:MAG: uracil-DNA glycosylase [Planctomycetales bacterium]|nr:uracil-DNA glycosylase [Planctomycetales bacterium]